jgi:hypothetical protein
MSDEPVHRDDITALRKEDDLHAYMRSLIRPTKTPAARPARTRKPKWGSIPIPPDHRPGAWPAGTQPPGRAPDRDRAPEEWTEAVNRYRTEARQQLDEEETP